jgi:hypothetical protein
VGQFEKIFPQGLKPKIIFAGFMYGLKPVPFKLIHYQQARSLLNRRIPPTIEELQERFVEDAKGKDSSQLRRGDG